MNLTKFLDPAAILELFLNKKGENAGSLCIKHGTSPTVSHYITLHHIVSVNSIYVYTFVIQTYFKITPPAVGEAESLGGVLKCPRFRFFFGVESWCSAHG